MIKGRFTIKKSEQGSKELEMLVRLLAPMLETTGSIKVKNDDERQYVYAYMDLYAPEKRDKKDL